MLLRSDKKFTSWTLKRVADAVHIEWNSLNPKLGYDVVSAYGHKLTRISFDGEVRITIDITNDKYPANDSVECIFLLSLSPDPNDLKMHVLNTFDLGMFLGIFPEFEGKKLFSIKKDEPWEGSALQTIARRATAIIAVMMQFDPCFHLLLDDAYEIDGVKLDMKSLSLTHHLNQVKAYRLAEIYGHPEKLDEAIEAIKQFARIDELSQQRLDKICTSKSAGGMDWLYTQKMIERLCK